LRTLDVPAALVDNILVSFLPDSRRLLLSGQRGVVLVDLADGKSRVLRPGEPSDRYVLSRDGRTLVIERPLLDSDIWLMEFAGSRQ
jgi:hypothetical protein